MKESQLVAPAVCVSNFGPHSNPVVLNGPGSRVSGPATPAGLLSDAITPLLNHSNNSNVIMSPLDQTNVSKEAAVVGFNWKQTNGSPGNAIPDGSEENPLGENQNTVPSLANGGARRLHHDSVSSGLKIKINRKSNGRDPHETLGTNGKVKVTNGTAALTNGCGGGEIGPSKAGPDGEESAGKHGKARKRSTQEKREKNRTDQVECSQQRDANGTHRCDNNNNLAEPPAKKTKVTDSANRQCRSVGTLTTSVGTVTEPDFLGPCEPGTAVTLEGIVWHETNGGVLVVNVTWRGKTYVGSLLDITQHDWAPPTICDSPPSDIEATRSPAKSDKLQKRCRNGLPELDTRTAMRAGKTRRGANFKTPSSPARSESSAPTSKGRKGRAPNNLKLPAGSPSVEAVSSPVEDKQKRGRKPGSGPSTPASADINATNCPVTVFECNVNGCSKKFPRLDGLRYHQQSQHGGLSAMDEMMNDDEKSSSSISESVDVKVCVERASSEPAKSATVETSTTAHVSETSKSLVHPAFEQLNQELRDNEADKSKHKRRKASQPKRTVSSDKDATSDEKTEQVQAVDTKAPAAIPIPAAPVIPPTAPQDQANVNVSPAPQQTFVPEPKLPEIPSPATSSAAPPRPLFDAAFGSRQPPKIDFSVSTAEPRPPVLSLSPGAMPFATTPLDLKVMAATNLQSPLPDPFRVSEPPSEGRASSPAYSDISEDNDDTPKTTKDLENVPRTLSLPSAVGDKAPVFGFPGIYSPSFTTGSPSDMKPLTSSDGHPFMTLGAYSYMYPHLAANGGYPPSFSPKDMDVRNDKARISPNTSSSSMMKTDKPIKLESVGESSNKTPPIKDPKLQGDKSKEGTNGEEQTAVLGKAPAVSPSHMFPPFVGPMSFRPGVPGMPIMSTAPVYFGARPLMPDQFPMFPGGFPFAAPGVRPGGITSGLPLVGSDAVTGESVQQQRMYSPGIGTHKIHELKSSPTPSSSENKKPASPSSVPRKDGEKKLNGMDAKPPAQSPLSR